MSEIKPKLNSFVHCGNTGDAIASLPAIREFYKKTGIKPVLYLVKDHPAKYYEGATHPVKNDNGEFVSFNAEMIKLLSPLIKAQPYIEDVREIHIGDVEFVREYAEFKDGSRAINLSWIRDRFCNIPYGDIRRWYFMILPELSTDLSVKYIDVANSEKDIAKNKIIICRTERYQNEVIDYSFLKPYEDDLLFAGTMREYNNFCMNFDLNIKKLAISDFYELAQALQQSKGLISNQTMIFQIAEGLKIPRVVEICSYAPNVIPVGENAFDFLDQVALEVYFHTLNGTMAEFVKNYKPKSPEQAGANENKSTELPDSGNNSSVS